MSNLVLARADDPRVIATQGLDRALPTPTRVGQTYYATDSHRMYRSTDGSTWDVEGVETAKAGWGAFTDASYIGSSTLGPAVGPTGGPGTTYAISFYVNSLPGTSGRILWCYSIASGVNGWAIGSSAVNSNKMKVQIGYSATLQTAELTGASISAGFHKLVFSIASNGLALNYAWDGVIQTPVVLLVAGNYNAPGASGNHLIGRWVASSLSNNFCDLHECATWGAVLPDGNAGTPNSLVALSDVITDGRFHGDTTTRTFTWASRWTPPWNSSTVRPIGTQAIPLATVAPTLLTFTNH